METGEGVMFYYINAKCGHFTNLAQAHETDSPLFKGPTQLRQASPSPFLHLANGPPNPQQLAQVAARLVGVLSRFLACTATK